MDCLGTPNGPGLTTVGRNDDDTTINGEAGGEILATIIAGDGVRARDSGRAGPGVHRIIARAVGANGEGGHGSDVSQAVIGSVETLGGVRLAGARGDGRAGRTDRDVVE